MQILKTQDGLQITLGSATGAYSTLSSKEAMPSFVLLDIDGPKVGRGKGVKRGGIMNVDN